MTDDFDNLDWLQDSSNDDDDSASGNDGDDFDVDWLQDSAGDDDDDLTTASDEDIGLDWLDDDEGSADILVEDDDEGLDWLTASDDDAAGDAASDDDAVPDWLVSAEASGKDGGDDDVAPEWLAEAEVGGADAFDDDAFDDDDDAFDDGAFDDDDDDDDDDAPEWLAETDDDDNDAVVGEGVPDWLTSVDDDDDDEEAVATGDFDDWDDDDEEAFIPESEMGDDDADALFDDLDDDDDEFYDDESEEEEVDDFFAEMGADADINDVPAVRSAGDFFASDAFDLIDDQEGSEFDVLGDMVAESDDLDDLLGTTDEFDLLGELTGDDDAGDDSGGFDLFSELTGGGDTAGDDDLLGEMLMDDIPQDAVDALDILDSSPVEPEITVDSIADTLEKLDELETSDRLKAARPVVDTPAEDEDDEFAWFGEETAPPEPVAAASDARLEDDFDPFGDLPNVEDMLDGLESDLPADPAASLDLEGDVDDFLDGLDGPEDFDNIDDLVPAMDIDFEDTGTFDDLLDDGLFDEDDDEGIDFDGDDLDDDDASGISIDAPDWLTDLSKESASSESTTAASVVRQQADRPLGELSDRLQALHNRGLELPATRDETGEVSRDSVIAGIKGALQPVALDAAAESSFSKAVHLTEAQYAQAEILRNIVGARAQAEEEGVDMPSVRRERPHIRVERFVVSVILVVLMALPFFDMGEIGDAPPKQFAADSSQQTFFDQIEQLQPEDKVLLAAEYGPTGAAELDAATMAVIRHILVRRAYPVVVGGHPTGLLHVNNLIEDLAEQNKDINALVRNEDYTIGRYLVADVIGLRQFVETIDEQEWIERDFWGKETGLSVASIDDFALIIVIAENAERLRVWAEQVAPYTHVPMLVVTGFSAEPFSEPYVDANDNIVGMMVGYQDALAYNQMLDRLLGLLPTETPTSVPTNTPIPTATPEPTDTPTETPELTRVPTDIATENAVDGQPTVDAAPTEESTPTREVSPTDVPTTTPLPTETPLPTDTPEPTATSEPVRFAVITSDGAINVRSGPETTFEVVGVAQPEERLVIIGENDDASWYNVTLADGTSGWIAAFLAEVEVIFDPTPTPAGEARLTQRESAAKAPYNAGAVGKDQAEETPELTPEITATLAPPTATPTPMPTATPTLEYTGVQAENGEWIAVYTYADDAVDSENRDARWYSITIGIVAAATIISLGAILNILHFLAKGLHSRERDKKRRQS